MKQQQQEQSYPAPAEPGPGQPEAPGLGVDLVAERRHELGFPAAEPVRQGRGRNLAAGARPQRHVRHRAPLERCQRPARRLRGDHAQGRSSRPRRIPQTPWSPWPRQTRGPGRRAHLEPAPRGQVDQGRAEPGLVQPPGQQADHGRRHVVRLGQPPRPALAPAISLVPRPALAPATPLVRPGRGRSDQQDDEQEQPPRAGDGGHRKHDIPLRPGQHPGAATAVALPPRSGSPAVPDTSAGADWFRRES